MRLIHYHIVNKITRKSIFVDCRKHKVDEAFAALEDKENYFIGYKWLSI